MMEKELSYPKDRIRILLLEGLHQSTLREFQKKGYNNIDYHKDAMSESELLTCIEDYHIIGIRSKTQLTKQVLEQARKLLTIGCYCIGTNQVDLQTAAEAGIAVFNSPFSNTRSVAELVIAESIMLLRRIPEKDHAAHKGIWLKEAKGSFELRGKTIGIIGYGHIGTQVGVMAEALGLRVIYFDIEPKLPLGNAHSKETLEEVLAESDIITLHVPATPETKNMMGTREFDKMKDGAVFINLSRGTVVDINALREAYINGKIAGAAIDVFPVEPKAKGPGFESPLQGLENILLTPHIGGSTMEAQENIGIEVTTKLISFLDSGSTVGSHALPPLSLPLQTNTRRILHIHRNIPGVLSEINKIMGDHGVNILGQYLKTTENIGYVVLDVDASTPEDVFDDLRHVKSTIKCRILY